MSGLFGVAAPTGDNPFTSTEKKPSNILGNKAGGFFGESSSSLFNKPANADGNDGKKLEEDVPKPDDKKNPFVGGSQQSNVSFGQSGGGIFGKPTEIDQFSFNTEKKPAESQLFESNKPIQATPSPFSGLFKKAEDKSNFEIKSEFKGELFGNPTQAPVPQGGLFGNPTQAPVPQGGLFGNTTQAPVPQGTGLFGNTTTGTTGGGLFGSFGKTTDPKIQGAGGISLFPTKKEEKPIESDNQDSEYRGSKLKSSDFFTMGIEENLAPKEPISSNLFDSQVFDDNNPGKDTCTFGSNKEPNKLFESQFLNGQVDKKIDEKSPSISMHFQRIESSQIPPDKAVLTDSVKIPIAKPDSIKPLDSKPSFGGQSNLFGMSSIAPQNQSLTTSGLGGGLFGSSFPKATEKKEETLRMVVKPEAPAPMPELIKTESSSFTSKPWSPTEVARDAKGLDFPKTEKEDYPFKSHAPVVSQSSWLKATVVSSDHQENTKKEQPQLKEETIENPMGVKEVPRDTIPHSQFVLPNHFPQMLLTCDYYRTTEILKEVFGLDIGDSVKRNKEALECIYQKQNQKRDQKKPTQLNHATLLRGLFESSTSLFMNLLNKSHRPISIVGPTVKGIPPSEAIDVVNTVMHVWSKNVFNEGEGPKLLWEDGSGVALFDLMADVSTQKDEKENLKAKEIWKLIEGHENKPSDKIAEEKSMDESKKESEVLKFKDMELYQSHLAKIEVELKKEIPKNFSVAFRYGTYELLISLKTTSKNTTVETIERLLQEKKVDLHRIVDKLNTDLSEKLQTYFEDPSISGYLQAFPRCQALMKENSYMHDFRLAKDSPSFYGDLLTLMPRDIDISTLRPEKGRCLQLFNTCHGFSSRFVKTVITAGGRPVFTRVVSVPREQSEEPSDSITLADIIVFTKLVCLAEQDSVASLVLSILNQEDNVRLDGKKVAGHDVQTPFSNLLDDSKESEVVHFLEFSLGEASPPIPISVKGVKIEVGPAVTLNDLKKANDETTVFISFKREDKRENEFEIGLPYMLGDYIRMSAFEPAYSRAVARVMKDKSWIWRELEYSPASVTWLSKEQTEKVLYGKWSCAMYQKQSHLNTHDDD
jgi:hypothetical protein